MHVLDSDILVDVLREYEPAVTWLRSLAEVPNVSGLVGFELFQGCRNTEEVRRVQGLLAQFPVVWPTPADCTRALTEFPQLHLRDGVGVLDILIGASAIGSNATLCTFNVKHFRAIPGLAIEQPYAKAP